MWENEIILYNVSRLEEEAAVSRLQLTEHIMCYFFKETIIYIYYKLFPKSQYHSITQYIY